MSKRVVCAVMDSAVLAFGQPIVAVSVGVVVRSFADEVNRVAVDNALSQHPEDYTLHFLAEFDDEFGSFSLPEGGQRVLARGKDVKQP
ncbi:MAG: nonstructural protein [Microvirus sp.]|nr:MAG: nonstructural protein [Microvirus sp.]